MREVFDYAILGAGVSGTMMAVELAARFPSSRILLIEKSGKDRDLQTFSYFSEGLLEIERLLAGSYRKLTFDTWLIRSKEQLFRFKGKRYRYHSIDSRDYFRTMHEEIERRPNVELRLDAALLLPPRTAGKAVALDTSQGVFYATRVLNSISQRQKSKLWQDFYGVRVSSSRPAFTPGEVMLMDFSEGEGRFSYFTYLIPTSTTEALVESTLITTSEHVESGTSEFHMNKLKGVIQGYSDSYSVECSEKGTLPMKTEKVSYPSHRAVTDIGAARQLIRPSTGFAFRNIERDTRALSAALQSVVGEPSDCDFSLEEKLERERSRLSGADSLRQSLERFMDKTLLSYIGDDPSRFTKMILGLAANCEADIFAGFMCEEASCLDLLRIVCSMQGKRKLAGTALRNALSGG